MTFYGIDVSEWQDGLSLKKAEAEGIRFVILRTNDGSYRDRVFHSHLAEADTTGLLKAAYVYMHKDVATSINTCLEMLGGRKDLPVWLDFEAPGEHFTADDIATAVRMLNARGVRCAGIYSYVPFWEGLGDPRLPDGLKVWVAAYPLRMEDTPGRVYSALCGAKHWQWQHPLSDVKPVMWQFTSSGWVGGFKVDCNAFEGSEAELQALFRNGGRKVSDMSIKDKASYYVRLIIEQLAGTGVDEQGRPLFKGWPQLGDRTLVDAIAAIGAKYGVEGFFDPKAKN